MASQLIKGRNSYSPDSAQSHTSMCSGIHYSSVGTNMEGKELKSLILVYFAPLKLKRKQINVLHVVFLLLLVQFCTGVHFHWPNFIIELFFLRFNYINNVFLSMNS